MQLQKIKGGIYIEKEGFIRFTGDRYGVRLGCGIA
jgi:hypothetical protein